MGWIVGAGILNTLWTFWCVQLLPLQVAVRFGTTGQAEGWMSRRGFALFSILFPLAMSAFIVFIGGTAKAVVGLPTAMEHIAAGLTLFFSFLSWCIVRSNRRVPPRVDYPSLFVSLMVLTASITLSLVGVSTTPDKANQSSVDSSSIRR
jgi:hypothetical protein